MTLYADTLLKQLYGLVENKQKVNKNNVLKNSTPKIEKFWSHREKNSLIQFKMKTLDNVRVSIRTLCIYGEQMYYFVGFFVVKNTKKKHSKKRKNQFFWSNVPKNQNPAW